MYNWIETTFNVSEGIAQGLALIISLAVVLVLFALFIFIIKRLIGANAPQNRSRQPRIAIMDSTTVDTRRRLLLVRRDNVEHLILIGGPSDVVVEQNIVRHTPLTNGQNRGAGYPAHQQGSGGIKSAAAPGPDLPVTPEVLSDMQQSEPPNINLNVATKEPKPSGTHKPSLRVADTPQPRFKSSATSEKSANPAISASAQLVRSKTETKNILAPKPVGDISPAVKSLSRSSPKAADTKTVTPEAATENKTTDKLPNKAGSAIHSSSKAFSPKDRPSYGSHKISPPSSGPAARAKTAFSNPADVEPATGKTEPSLSPKQTKEQVKKTAPELSAAPPAQIEQQETGPAVTTSLPAASSDTDNKTDVPPTKLEAALKESIEEELGPNSNTAKSSNASEEKPDDQVAPKAPEAQTDTVEISAPTKDGSKELAAAIDAPNEEEPAQADGLGSRNPIEEEMAKILDEVGGQPKQ
ncbi:MAG: hypothetical protein ABJL55_07920 [Roseibium sp.]